MPPDEPDVATPTVAVLLAGGVGARVGGTLPKQLIRVAEKPVMEHPLAVLDQHEQVDEIVILMAPGYLDAVREMVASGGYAKVSAILEGAETRSRTTMRALAHLAERYGDTDVNVLLHDAVRPVLSPRIITDCVSALREHAAVNVAIPSADTIVVVTADDIIADVPARTTLRRSQTPQAFKLSVLRRAYDLAAKDPGFEATDDCSVVLRYAPDVPVRVIAGDERNLKVTRPIDLVIAEALLRMEA